MNLVRELHGLEPNILFHIGPLAVASSTMTIFFLIIVFLLFGLLVCRRYQLNPISQGQVLVEMVFEGIAGLVDNITNDRATTNRIVPVIGAVLIYILIANLVEILPGLGSITYHGHPVFTGPTADFNTTVGLAIAAVLVINVLHLHAAGVFGYLAHFFNLKNVVIGFKNGFASGAVAVVELFVGLLEFIGEFTRVISLSLRLFGNMYAHSIIAMIVLGLVGFVIPTAVMFLGMFIGLLQAVVFASLVAAYYTLAVKPGQSHH